MVLITSLGLFAAAFEGFKVDGMRAVFVGVAFPLFPGTSSDSVVYINPWLG